MSNWPKVTLDEVCDIRIGRTPRRNQQKYWGGENIWLSIADLKTDVVSDSSECITDIAVEEAMPEPVPAGTLLFSFKLTIGRMAFAGVPLYTNEAIAALIVKDKNRLDKRYLKYILSVTAHSTEASHAAKGKTLNKQKLRRIEISLPPIDVQEKIVSKLDRANQLRKKRDEADKKMAAFAPALFHQMFGDPGKNEKGWEMKKLDEVAAMTSGGTPSRQHPEYYGGKIPWVKSGELHQPVVLKTEEALTEEGLNMSSAKLQPIGAVLIAMYGATVGAISELGIEASTNQAICCVIPNKESLIKEYFIQALKLRTSELLGLRTGGAQPNLSQEKIKALNISIPPIALQKQYAAHIAGVQKMLEQQFQGRKKLDEVFEGVLNEWL